MLSYDDKSWLIWLQDLSSLSQSIQGKYPLYMNRFLERLELTPDELYDVKMKELSSKDPRDRLGVERKLKRWLVELEDGGSYKAGTVQLHYYAVRSFFESQSIPFSLKPSDRPKGDHVGRRMITKPMISRMVELAGIRQRNRNLAMLFTLKDSGLRIGDITDLTVQQYNNARVYRNEDGERFKELPPLTTKKAKITAYSMLGPEAIKYIDEYLETRTRNSSYLFLGERGKKIRGDLVSKIFQRWADKLRDGTRISAHSFRKFHQTQLEASGLNPNILKKLQGRRIMDSTAAYSKPEDQPGLIANQYMNHYDALRLNDNSPLRELRREQQDKIHKIESTLEQLKKQQTELLQKLKMFEG